MEVVASIDGADVLDRDPAEFFAPAPTSLIDGLLAEYQARRAQIDRVVELVAGDLGSVMHYFIEGNAGDDRTHRSLYVDKLFELDGAVHALDAAYWSKALSLTDVYDYMPQARRNAWNEQMRNPAGVPKHRHEPERGWAQEPLPAFVEEAVKPTIAGLLAMRSQFFAERVDGIFRALSREHVTNAPEAFGRRMIMNYVTAYGYVQHERAGVINDLRCVLAKFMGRDEPKHNATTPLLRSMEQCTGKWISADGGAFRVRLYKKGTAHLEVHPDMAWRLNCVLAQLHPAAIPSQFRQRPPRRLKEFEPLLRPLPFRVLEAIAAGEFLRGSERLFRPAMSHDAPQEVRAEAMRVLASLGGVATANGTRVEFPHDARELVRTLCILGSLPDQVSHQFYATPARLVRIATELAEVGPGDSVLEPSAGQGHLAALLPADQVTCVELSALHCAALRGRGFRDVHEADFVAWADAQHRSGHRFSRILMNPPFSDGRARAHLDAAAGLLSSAPGARLVAILPASMRGRAVDSLPGLQLQWSPVFANEFDGCGAAVAILAAVRPAGSSSTTTSTTTDEVTA